MWTGLFLVILVVGVWALIEGTPPLTCPHCLRFNVFWRRKTGRSFSDMDTDECLVRRSDEIMCARCGQPYWIIWDDFDGRGATKELQRRQ
jgi:hypothetical protein